MKSILSLIILAGTIIYAEGQGCPTCGGYGSGGVSGYDTGPNFSISLGQAQDEESAGDLTFGNALPEASLHTPAALQYDFPTRTDVTVVTNTDGSIRQVNAPQALADVPVPPTTNGYAINFYFASQVGAINPDGTYTVSGTPFVTWIVTNPVPSSGINQLQVSKFGNVPDYGLIKQWTYAYSPQTGAWTNQTLDNIQEIMSVVSNPNDGTYQVINSVQYANGTMARQVKNTYTNLLDPDDGSIVNTPLALTAVGADSTPEITAYTYWSPGQFTSGSQALVNTVTHPDGSWEYYGSYNGDGYPITVYSSFGDAVVGDTSNGRATHYTYGSSPVSGSGDDGTLATHTARLVVRTVKNVEVSRSYTVFPSVGERLDIQCTTLGSSGNGALWNDPNNLVTTNLFYTSGPNQFALQAVIHPDHTMTVYNYITNGLYQTNITVTGQPDSTYTYVVDGVSNVIVLNLSGYTVSAASYDVISGITLSQDTYCNFDSYGRPQQVTHLNGTTEYTAYTCCGVDYTADRDGVTNVYVYDADKRLVGNAKFFSNANPVTWQNTLDAAGSVVQAARIGTDNSLMITAGSAYDLAGELIAQTNALGGVTTYARSNDPNTGGLIRTTTYPNGGTRIEAYYLDGLLKSVTGTAVHGKAYGYGTGTDAGGNACTYTVETNLDAGGNPTSEWTQTFTDMAGRTTEVLYSDASGSKNLSFYNSAGQLWKQVDPDGVTTLYPYNGKGELAYTIVALSSTALNINDYPTLLGNLSALMGGADRITQTTNDVTFDSTLGTNVRRSRTYVWLDGQSTGMLVSQTETSTDGLNTWQTQYRDVNTPVTAQSQTVYTSPTRTVTSAAPDGSSTVSTYSYGRLISSVRYDSNHAQIGGTTDAYDAHGRQYQVTDARNGATTYGYNNADQVNSVTTPNPGNGSPEVTTTAYNNMMQVTGVTQPDGTAVYSAWLLTGELGLQYGSRTYPVGYGYDYAGRMKTMTNWSGFSTLAGARVTTWKYDGYRGWLTNKVYADGQGPSYNYTSAGRLQKRIWARPVGDQPLATTYGYNSAGSLSNVVYSDGTTPAVTNKYDRLGRLTSVVCKGMTDTLTYNLANQLLGESFSGGILNGLSVTNGYDADLRRTKLAALSASSQLMAATYGYDAASRLQTVSDGNNDSATYNYLANSLLVSQIAFKQGSTTRMTTTKQYDFLNRLTQISSAPNVSGTLPLAFNYNYNPANQRTKDTLADGSYWIYGYDSLGQVTNACKYWADHTPVAGQQFDYAFDTIGNRTQTLSGGDTNGLNLRVANYSANTLNQITQRDVPGTNDVTGAAWATNRVSVNGMPAGRKVEYFQGTVGTNNAGSAFWLTTIVTNGTGSSVTGHIYVAKEPEVFQYDPDGNLTNDGRFAYVWDGENRLVSMTNNTGVGPKYGLAFAYDYQGRRIQKLVATNGVALYTNRFLYDGWNLIATLTPNSQLQSAYMWGNDLSGSLQGAGGVGGLLEVSYHGTGTTNCFPALDGNGNVAALINAVDGTVVANYDYAAFGEPIRMTGSMARNNPFRFSTKYADDESDLLYYGYRYYKPSTGTWPNRDPMQEKGGINLYAFVNNSSISHVDPKGHSPLSIIAALGPCAAKLIDSAFKDMLTVDSGCAAAAAYGALHPDVNLCTGYSFYTDNVLTFNPTTLSDQLKDCILDYVKGQSIDQLLEEIQDPVERYLLSKLLDGLTIPPDKPTIDYKVLVRAKCSSGRPLVTIAYETDLKDSEGNSTSIDRDIVAQGRCGLIWEATTPLEGSPCCCSGK
jgi:RHS repeat-associated protein